MFGIQCINSESAQQTVTVSNTSACATLTVTAITKSGLDFILSGLPSFPKTVAPGGNFTFKVSFKPATVGAKSGTVSIASNDPDETTRTVMLSGTGAASNIAVSPTSLMFGNQPVGTTSAAKMVTVSNTAVCPLTVTEIKLQGTNPGDFILSSLPSLPTTVLVGRNFKFDVKFKPTASGARAASLKITSNDPDSPMVTISLSGTGT
jgi:hypothetical protein